MSHPVDNHAAEPATEPAVQARGLRKRFGDFTAVKGIDVTIPRGVCFGFLGPNGAGKSTTMRMIYRASDVDEGSLSVLGYDASVRANDRAIKARIGVVHQEDNLDEDLTVRETIEVFARFHRLKGAAIERKVHELLAFADLSEREHHKVRALSGGMKQLELGEAPPEGAARWAGVERAEVFGDRLLLYTATPERAAGAALAQLPGRRVLTRRGTLDDVFLRLTGHGLDDT